MKPHLTFRFGKWRCVSREPNDRCSGSGDSQYEAYAQWYMQRVMTRVAA